MRKDRARIQIGRISPFGLLELSRQRLRTSITETMTEICLHCGGSGHRRSIESTALHVLRGIDEHCNQKKSDEIEVSVHSQVALYILNHKRDAITAIETKFALKLILLEDDKLIPPEFVINRTPNNNQKNNIQEKQSDSSSGHSKNVPKRKKRNRSRKNDHENPKIEDPSDVNDQVDKEEMEVKDTTISDKSKDHQSSDTKEKNVRRRRGRRGGRNNNRDTGSNLTDNQKVLSHNGDLTEQTQISMKVVKDNSIQDLEQKSGQKLNSIEIENGGNSHAIVHISGKEEVKDSNIEDNGKSIDDRNENSLSNSSYNPNVTVVGEDKPKDQKSTRGGWWKKITNS
jgi:ribonuclease E